MLLTSATAWAQTTETLGGYEFTIETDADGDYYVVDSKEALTAIANYVNDNSENNCTGKRFKQTGNITLSGTWTPIGKLESSTYYYFKGTYDGAGYNISGLNTNLDVRSGLFGVIGSGGIVKNVNVVNCLVQGGQRVGGIVGYNSSGTIDNCTVSGTILPNTSDTKKHFGGICGYSTGTIKNCTNFATIRNTGSKKSENSGGIAGYNGGSIQNCFTVGTININDNSTYIGVVVGRNSSKGTISGTYYYAGTSGYDAVGENNNTTEGSVDVTRLYTFTSISGLTIVGTHFIIGGQTYCTNVDGCYYAIADEQDLIDLAEYVRSASDHNCEGLTFKMTRDLDFTNMPADCHDNANNGSGNFLPIGVDKFYGDGSFFKGHFDGQGHTITGLRFNSTYPNIGLFSTIGTSETVIEGVTLVVPNFYGDGCVGGIVGALYAGTIRNCAVVNGTISGRNGRVGGIVGLCNYYSSTDVKTISGCTVIATTVNATTVNGSSEIGTIVGKNQDTSEATAAPTISGCTYHNPAGLPVCGVGNYTDGGGNQQVYQVRLSDGLTASTAAYSYGNDYYFANNATVTLGHGDRPGYDFSGYESNDVTVSNGTFTMPASDVTVGATWTPSDNIALTANAANGDYWTTFYCGDAGYKIDDAEDAYAYTATYASSTLTLHKLGKVIPAGKAVIIVGEDNSISMTKSTDVAQYTVSNHLHGVDVRTEKSTLGTGTFYVLGKKNDVFGFYQYTADYMPARKAYLLVNGGPSLAKGLTMVFGGDATSVVSMHNAQCTMHNDAWFTLDGRRLAGKPTTKGIYIHNGRKEVLK